MKHEEKNLTVFQETLGRVDTALNSTHILLDYVVAAYKANRDLERELPALEHHLDIMNRFAGSPGKGAAEHLMKMIDDRPDELQKAGNQ